MNIDYLKRKSFSKEQWNQSYESSDENQKGSVIIQSNIPLKKAEKIVLFISEFPTESSLISHIFLISDNSKNKTIEENIDLQRKAQVNNSSGVNSSPG